MAWRSRSSIQWSRGTKPLCSLAFPYRWRQSKYFPRAIPFHPTSRTAGNSVWALSSRTKSTTTSRVSWGTHAPVRAPQVLFSASRTPRRPPQSLRPCAEASPPGPEPWPPTPAPASAPRAAPRTPPAPPPAGPAATFRTRWVGARLVAHLRHRNLVHQVPLQQGRLLVRRVLTALALAHDSSSMLCLAQLRSCHLPAEAEHSRPRPSTTAAPSKSSSTVSASSTEHTPRIPSASSGKRRASSSCRRASGSIRRRKETRA